MKKKTPSKKPKQPEPTPPSPTMTIPRPNPRKPTKNLYLFSLGHGQVKHFSLVHTPDGGRVRYWWVEDEQESIRLRDQAFANMILDGVAAYAPRTRRRTKARIVTTSTVLSKDGKTLATFDTVRAARAFLAAENAASR